MKTRRSYRYDGKICTSKKEADFEDLFNVGALEHYAGWAYRANILLDLQRSFQDPDGTKQFQIRDSSARALMTSLPYRRSFYDDDPEKLLLAYELELAGVPDKLAARCVEDLNPGRAIPDSLKFFLDNSAGLAAQAFRERWLTEGGKPLWVTAQVVDAAATSGQYLLMAVMALFSPEDIAAGLDVRRYRESINHLQIATTTEAMASKAKPSQIPNAQTVVQQAVTGQHYPTSLVRPDGAADRVASWVSVSTAFDRFGRIRDFLHDCEASTLLRQKATEALTLLVQNFLAYAESPHGAVKTLCLRIVKGTLGQQPERAWPLEWLGDDGADIPATNRAHLLTFAKVQEIVGDVPIPSKLKLPRTRAHGAFFVNEHPFPEEPPIELLQQPEEYVFGAACTVLHSMGQTSMTGVTRVCSGTAIVWI